jgi:hypothetical protein
VPSRRSSAVSSALRRRSFAARCNKTRADLKSTNARANDDRVARHGGRRARKALCLSERGRRDPENFCQNTTDFALGTNDPEKLRIPPARSVARRISLINSAARPGDRSSYQVAASSAAIRHPRAHHPRPADNAGIKAQPDRDRARSRLHQPERVRASLPPRRWHHADGVSKRAVNNDQYPIHLKIPTYEKRDRSMKFNAILRARIRNRTVLLGTGRSSPHADS